ncbi:hypothetical protein [Nostocoides sp. HKS02]|uniref:hypothetical protein n=1 Tax=Nostocoides sp. HKS02 TaxID=1813880 RepID=UPI0012B48F8B|nr:hypothetical protein [Tetrasphaera sp. HKS02]QGN57915.1 hypothetical protein GKE56_08510 [Tetrasphaera sp. HKS02]
MTNPTDPYATPHDPYPAHPAATGPTAPTGPVAPTAPVAPAAPTAPTAQTALEIVPRGILFSLAAIPLGMVTAVLIWKAGFVASISSFLVAGSAVFLYRKGAMATPRRGLVPLIVVIIVGVVASFFAIVGADLVEYYNTPDGKDLGYPSAVDFVGANLFNLDLLKSYGSDLAMFAVFAVLGVFGTMRRLMASSRR